MSEIKFTANNKEFVRHGNVSVGEMVAQATAEFGQINVTETTNDAEGPYDTHAASLAVLESCLINTKLVFDQLESLDDDYPMADAKMHILSAMASIDSEVTVLRG